MPPAASSKQSSEKLIESLVVSINHLSLEDKQKLADILEQQIFEAEEDAETVAEIKAVKAAYAAGEYDTYEDYVANRSATETKTEILCSTVTLQNG